MSLREIDESGNRINQLENYKNKLQFWNMKLNIPNIYAFYYT